MRGGYQCIDFKNVNISTTDKKINGIYSQIENNYRKPLLLVNGVVNGVERPECTAFVVVENTNFNIYYGNPKYYIRVTQNDNVKLIAIS